MEAIFKEISKQKARLDDIESTEDLIHSIPYGIVKNCLDITYGIMSTYRLNQISNGGLVKTMDEVILLSELTGIKAERISEIMELKFHFPGKELLKLKIHDDEK